jgi:hypothetical protein
MSDCVCGFNPPNDPNPDCERCQLISENHRNQHERDQAVENCKRLAESVDRLETENAQLIHERDDALNSACDNRETFERVMADNQRLREANENFAARFYCGNCACNGCDRARERRRQAEGGNDE